MWYLNRILNIQRLTFLLYFTKVGTVTTVALFILSLNGAVLHLVEDVFNSADTHGIHYFLVVSCRYSTMNRAIVLF